MTSSICTRLPLRSFSPEQRQLLLLLRRALGPAFLDPTSSKIPINSVIQTSLQNQQKLSTQIIFPSIQSFPATSISELSSKIILLLWGASTRPLGLNFFLVFYLKLLLLRKLSLLGNFGNFWIASEIHKFQWQQQKIV